MPIDFRSRVSLNIQQTWTAQQVFEGTGAVLFKNAINGFDVRAYGALGNGVANDTAAIQAAIDAAEAAGGGVVIVPPGTYVTNAPLVVGTDEVYIIGAGSGATTIKFTGTAGQAAISGPGTLVTRCQISGLYIEINGDGAYGIDWTWFSYSLFRDLWVSLRNQTQVGFYAKGNGLGSGPYYNSYDQIICGGRNDGVTYPDQIGFRLASATSGGFSADGPNANQFTHLRRIFGLSKAFDIQAGNGNTGSDFSFESLQDVGIDFNNRAPKATGTATAGTSNTLSDAAAAFTVSMLSGSLVITAGTGAGMVALITAQTATQLTFEPTQSFVIDNTSVYEVYEPKARNSRFSNIRHEGASGCIPVYNRYGGQNNRVINYMPDSLGVGLWTNDALDPDSLIFGSGVLVPVTFSAVNLAAASTIELSPVGGVSSGAAGGIKIASNAHAHSAATAMDGFGAAGAGSVTIRVYRDGGEITGLTHILNVNNRFGTKKVTNTVPSATASLRNRNLRVTATTDGSWDQTASDISVTVWVMI